MAEVLGVTASILQVVTTGVQVSLYLYSFAETVSSAGKAMKDISNDISFTTTILKQLGHILESEKQNQTASKEALLTAQSLVKECENVFDAINSLIRKHFPKPESEKSKSSQSRRTSRMNSLKWPFIQPKIELHRSNLEKHKTKLILMTQVLTYAKMAASESVSLTLRLGSLLIRVQTTQHRRSIRTRAPET